MTPSYWHLPSKQNSNLYQVLSGVPIANCHRKYAGRGIILTTLERAGDFNKYRELILLLARESKFLITIKRKGFRSKIDSSDTGCSLKSPLKATLHMIY